jgi:hypothetical protein
LRIKQRSVWEILGQRPGFSLFGLHCGIDAAGILGTLPWGTGNRK